MADRKVVMDSQHPAMSSLQARIPLLTLLSHLHKGYGLSPAPALALYFRPQSQ